MSTVQRQLTDYPTATAPTDVEEVDNSCDHMAEYQTDEGCLRCDDYSLARETIAESQQLADETNGGVR